MDLMEKHGGLMLLFRFVIWLKHFPMCEESWGWFCSRDTRAEAMSHFLVPGKSAGRTSAKFGNRGNAADLESSICSYSLLRNEIAYVETYWFRMTFHGWEKFWFLPSGHVRTFIGEDSTVRHEWYHNTFEILITFIIIYFRKMYRFFQKNQILPLLLRGKHFLFNISDFYATIVGTKI